MPSWPFGCECGCGVFVDDARVDIVQVSVVVVVVNAVSMLSDGGQVRRPDDYDAKKVADLGPSEPSQTLNSLVLSQLKRPPPPPPAPVLPPAPVMPLGPTPSGEVEDGEVGVAAPVVTRVLKLEHMVSHATS